MFIRYKRSIPKYSKDHYELASFLNILTWGKLQKVGGDIVSLLVVVIVVVVIVVVEISDLTNSLKWIRAENSGKGSRLQIIFKKACILISANN